MTSPLRQHFIIEGKARGFALRSAVIVHAEVQEPRHMSFVCQSCGVQWAICPVEGVATPNWWQNVVAPCRLHPWHGGTIAGSLLLDWDREFSQAVLSTDGAALWEFQRHLEFIERRQKGRPC